MFLFFIIIVFCYSTLRFLSHNSMEILRYNFMVDKRHLRPVCDTNELIWQIFSCFFFLSKHQALNFFFLYDFECSAIFLWFKLKFHYLLVAKQISIHKIIYFHWDALLAFISFYYYLNIFHKFSWDFQAKKTKPNFLHKNLQLRLLTRHKYTHFLWCNVCCPKKKINYNKTSGHNFASATRPFIFQFLTINTSNVKMKRYRNKKRKEPESI